MGYFQSYLEYYLPNTLIRGLTVLKLGWDDKVLNIVASKWNSWISLTSNVNFCLKISTLYYFESNYRSLEIHGFADASDQAYFAVYFCLLIYENSAVVN